MNGYDQYHSALHSQIIKVFLYFKKYIRVLLVILSITGFPASASDSFVNCDDCSNYFFVNATNYTITSSPSSQGFGDIDGSDDTSKTNGFEIGLGSKLNDNFDIELRFGKSTESDTIHVDEEEGTIIDVDAKIERHLSFSVIHQIKIYPRLSAYLLGGYSLYKVEPSIALEPEADSDVQENGISLGLGLKYILNSKYYMALEYKSFDPSGVNIESVSLGIGYHF